MSRDEIVPSYDPFSYLDYCSLRGAEVRIGLSLFRLTRRTALAGSEPPLGHELSMITNSCESRHLWFVEDGRSQSNQQTHAG